MGLVAFRCALRDPIKTQLPEDCLSGAILDSAACYDTFVNDNGADTVDMSYNIARHLVPKNLGVLPPKKTRRTFIATTAYNRVHRIGDYWEIEGTATLDDFAAAGQAMLVGSPLLQKAGQQKMLPALFLSYAYTCLQNERSDENAWRNERYDGILHRAAERYGVSLQTETILPYHLAVIAAKKSYYFTADETIENPRDCLGARVIRDEEKARQLLDDENSVVFVDYRRLDESLLLYIARRIDKNNYILLSDGGDMRLVAVDCVVDAIRRDRN